MHIAIAPSKRSFTNRGQPWFYLADTVWAAFTNVSQEDWQAYLAYRRRQRFNALQISVLPIPHDASLPGLGLEPFARDAAGRWDFDEIQPAYFARAEALLQAATEQGFTPALALLWCNYVPGTWGAKLTPEAVMPRDAMLRYVEHAAQAFARFDPIYIVSGDTDLASPEAISSYASALELVKRHCPDALTTLHLAPFGELPEELVRSPHLDFYMYQSGHGAEQTNAYAFGERYWSLEVARPIVNGEPCYEGHGRGGHYGRFTAFEVRKALWQSLLSGACAGFTYGAHGIWSWHTTGQTFLNESFSLLPFDRQEALRLEGAWDASFARDLLERYGLQDLEPQPGIQEVSTLIKVAASADLSRVAVYVPFPIAVTLTRALPGYVWTLIDLAVRRWEDLAVGDDDGRTIIPMHRENHDILVVGVRR